MDARCALRAAGVRELHDVQLASQRDVEATLHHGQRHKRAGGNAHQTRCHDRGSHQGAGGVRVCTLHHLKPEPVKSQVHPSPAKAQVGEALKRDPPASASPGCGAPTLAITEGGCRCGSHGHAEREAGRCPGGRSRSQRWIHGASGGFKKSYGWVVMQAAQETQGPPHPGP